VTPNLTSWMVQAAGRRSNRVSIGCSNVEARANSGAESILGPSEELTYSQNGPSVPQINTHKCNPNLRTLNSPHAVLESSPATPDRRTRRKSMSRRSGQNGYIERKGKAFYVRFWIDVPGQEKRAHKCIRICPVNGDGKLTKPERERRAKQIIAESGADTQEYFNSLDAVDLGVTFREQAKWFLNHVKSRKRKPIKPATATSWASHLRWISLYLGDMPLASVNNLALKELVSKMSETGFSAKTMHNYLQVVKMVVASAVNDHGDELYPRRWNHEFIDLPEVTNQRTPTFTEEEITNIVSVAKGQFRVLFSLLSGTGLRIGEALALEVKDICDSKITVRQGVWNGIIQSPKTRNGLREVDVHSSLASLLGEHIADRQSGFLFQNTGGKPISQTNILKRGLYPILEAVGMEKRGFHSFRRFRVTRLRKNGVPEDLVRFWIGHGDKSVTDGYSKIREDRTFRKACAENVGLGFEVPSPIRIQVPEVVPTYTQSELMSEVQ
jgi:integrase